MSPGRAKIGLKTADLGGYTHKRTKVPLCSLFAFGRYPKKEMMFKMHGTMEPTAPVFFLTMWNIFWFLIICGFKAIKNRKENAWKMYL